MDAVTAISSTFQIIPATARTIAVVSGDGQTATVGAAYASPLKASVTDSFGNPISGAAVAFAGPANGAGVTFGGPATVNTDANGVVASPGLTANNLPGTFQITASTSGALSPAAFTLTNVAGSASKLSFGQQPTMPAGKSIAAATADQDSVEMPLGRQVSHGNPHANPQAQLPHATWEPPRRLTPPVPPSESPEPCGTISWSPPLRSRLRGSNSFRVSAGAAASIKVPNTADRRGTGTISDSLRRP